MTGSELHRVTAPDLDHGQQLRVLSHLSARLDLEGLVQAIPDALAGITHIDGVRYRAPDGGTGAEAEIKAGRRARHSIDYRLLPGPDESLGMLTLYRGRAFREAELAAVEAALPLVMLCLRNALAYRAALASAHTDSLTGIGNRAALENHGRAQIDLAHRHKLPLSLLLIDIDYFKRINDSYGHAKGDVVLRTLARTVCRAVRRSDQVFRYGGEEFVVMLAHTDLPGAEAMAERIRVLVAGSRDLNREIGEGVTVSVGVGTLHDGDSLESLCDRADTALYRAKRNGRNRVATPDPRTDAAPAL